MFPYTYWSYMRAIYLMAKYSLTLLKDFFNIMLFMVSKDDEQEWYEVTTIFKEKLLRKRTYFMYGIPLNLDI